jgi:hypothetical protein
VRTGRTNTATLVIQNLGNVAAIGTVSVGLYSSADVTFDASDAQLATVLGKTIKVRPGRSVKVKLKILPPVDLAAGTFSLIAVTTSATDLPDVNLANDTAVTGTTP